VELKRTFRIVPRTEAEARASAETREHAAILHYTQTGELPETDLTWVDVLEHSLAIILGESGSGKTWEFENRVEILRNKHAVAFFLRLEDLIAGTLFAAVREADRPLFDRWWRGNDKATFFVDSVDESKFARPSDFKRALEHLHDGLGDFGSKRVQIMISSRISEWSPETDERYVARLFAPLLGVAEHDVKEPARLMVMQLNSLSRQQVLDFARDHGVADVGAFGESIDSASAWEMARRPIDVVELASFWMQNGRLGTLREIVENSVARNLREDREQGVIDPLSPEQVRTGAETLAAASILCRQFNFKIPDSAHTSGVPGLDASGCLPASWRPADTRALRMRPIFDSAIYGRIRFHHRRLAEFLCARWWDRLFDVGLTNLDFDQVFFATKEVGKVLKPSLAPVAAWLAIGSRTRNEKIRELLIRHAPETFLAHGDPEELPLEYKERIISAILENVRVGRRIWEKTTPEAAGRLADRALAAFLNARLLDPHATQDIQEFVLKLILEAGLTECGEAVISLLRRPETLDETKVYAILALRDCANQHQRRAIADTIEEQESISPFVAARVAEACFPQVITVDGLKALLSKTENDHDDTVNLPYYLRSRLSKVLTSAQSRELLVALVELTRSEPRIPDDSDREPVAQNFRWLRKVIPVVLLKLLEKDSLDESDLQAAFAALDVVGISPRQVTDDVQVGEALRARINWHAELRATYFWHRARKFWERGRVIRATEVYEFTSYFVLRHSDWDWMLRDLAQSDPGKERILAQEGALHLIAVRGGKIQDVIAYLAKVEARSPSAFLGSPSWVAMRLGLRWWWNGSRFSKYFEPTWWEQHWGVLKSWMTLQRSRLVLFRRLRDLREAKRPHWLYKLASEAHEPNKYGVSNWERVEKDYGTFITSAARQGCVRYWREFDPKLPYDWPDNDRPLWKIIVGLSGLSAEFEASPNSISNLSGTEADLASRYAVHEMNGFASWLPKLMQTQRDAVMGVLSECIDQEWTWSQSLNRPSGVISSLVWNGEGLRNELSPVLISRLNRGDPANSSVLRSVLRLVMSENLNAAAAVGPLAAGRSVLYEVQTEAWLLWVSTWLQVDATAAISYLESIVSHVSDRKLLMIHLCNALEGERERGLAALRHPSYLEPDALRLLIIFIFSHLKLSDDLVRKGHFTPNGHDDAARFRDSLVYRLAESENPAATLALKQIKEHPLFNESGNVIRWLSNLYDKRCLSDSESAPWTEADIREYETTFEKEPRNDEELFNLVDRRLIDLSSDLQEAESSIRSEVHIGQNESFLRGWIARKLRDRSVNRYTVPEESVIDPNRYPDIRVEKPGVKAVSIEVKWADEWTLTQLLERLENQLVGTYLRPRSLRFGIYAVGYKGRKTYWEQTEGPNLYFEALVRRLEERARELSLQRPGDLVVKIAAFDFRQPTVP
jgi:hypothetical protein